MILLFSSTVPRPLFDSSEAGSILCGTALVLGAAVATASVDKLGRKVNGFISKHFSPGVMFIKC